MKWVFAAMLFAGSSACVQLPPVYLIDRHTVMEVEASGEWPELEKRLAKESLSMGPARLSDDPTERRRERAFRILNDEFTSIAEPTE